MKIAVVGTGYVGLVTGTCFSETGNTVTCIDIDEKKVRLLNRGKIPIYEPKLDVYFRRNIKEGRLKFTSNLAHGLKDAKVIFLALPTPSSADGSADLSFILSASKDISKYINNYVVIVNKSTVPVGSANKVAKTISDYTNVKFDVVSNPEFLREGRAVDDFMKPDRVVIGSSSEQALKIMRTLYRPFVRHGNPIIEMDTISAELTKYSANAFLATKISFMNDIALLCEKTGADIKLVQKGMASDHRIGGEFLHAGIGYGGSCFPKDVLALSYTGSEYDHVLRIIDAVQEINQSQKRVLAQKVLKYFNQNITNKTFALWGLAFKPDTDDIREAPSLEIINTLIENGANVVAYDPEAMGKVKKMIKSKKLKFVANEYEALDNADALLIATEWKEFNTPDFDKINKLLLNPIIFDGRNLFTLDEMKENGFHYESIGRPVIN